MGAVAATGNDKRAPRAWAAAPSGTHDFNGDTTAFIQFLTSDPFKDFPTPRFIIPRGGGVVPYDWGRYRGLAQVMRRPPLAKTAAT